MNIISNINCIESKNCVLEHFSDYNIKEYSRLPPLSIIRESIDRIVSGDVQLILMEKDEANNWLRLLRFKYELEQKANIMFGKGPKTILVAKRKTKEIIWGFKYGLSQCISLPSNKNEIRELVKNCI